MTLRDYLIAKHGDKIVKGAVALKLAGMAAEELARKIGEKVAP